MPRTANALVAVLARRHRMSSAAAVDYGFCRMLYHQQKKLEPDACQLALLLKTYALALEVYGPEWLHRHMIDGTLREALTKLTDSRNSFDWVAFVNE